MATPTTKTITPTLDDDATRCYPDWFKGSMLVSMSYRDADGINGLLVYVLTAAQWAAHPTNIQVGGGPRPAPTWPMPVPPVGAAANALVAACERQLKRFDAHQVAVAEFTAILLESIGPANRALIADPVFGMTTVTIPVIMQRMAAEHGTPSTSDLFKLKAELKARLVHPSDFPTHLANYQINIAKLAFFQHPVPAYDIFTTFVETINHHPAFQSQLQLYFSTNPTPNTHTLLSLTAMLTGLPPI